MEKKLNKSLRVASSLLKRKYAFSSISDEFPYYITKGVDGEKVRLLKMGEILELDETSYKIQTIDADPSDFRQRKTINIWKKICGSKDHWVIYSETTIEPNSRFPDEDDDVSTSQIYVKL